MKKVALVISWLVSLAVVAGLAANAAMKNQKAAFGVGIAEVQAVLAFNHMGRYRELEGFLQKGCYSEALEKAKISKYQEMELLASFLRDHPNTSVNKYISDRDPRLIEMLATFKNPYGSTWSEPQCGK